jgi:hypothetical protein
MLIRREGVAAGAAAAIERSLKERRLRASS